MSVISTDKMTQFARDILMAAGTDKDQAEGVAEVLVWSNAHGRPNQGVWRLPILTTRIKKGLFNTPCSPTIKAGKAAVAAMFGDNGIGHYVGRFAVDTAIERAKEHGIATVAVSDSNFLGTCGYYVNRIADQGMIGIMWNNSFPKVAAHGGQKPVFGTNPIAFAAPRKSDGNIIVDLSTGASAGSTITKAIENGESIAKGIAVDKDGNPITDPSKVAGGTLLPFGGAKGYGLSLMVEILAGVLSGAGISKSVRSMYGDMENPGNSGHFFIAIEIDALMDMETYYQRLELLIGYINESEGVQLPGDNRWNALIKMEQAGGINLDKNTIETLTGLAAELGVATPW